METGEQTLLGNYGSLISSYQGEGVLVTNDGREQKCTFEAGQTKAGDVLLLCDFLPPWPDSIDILADRFRGVTKQGWEVISEGSIFEINYLPDAQPNAGDKFLAAFRLQHAHVRLQPDGRVAQSARFGITNFLFLGIESSPSQGGFPVLPLVLKMGERESRVVLQPLLDYVDISRRIQTLKAIDVTCELVCDIAQFADIDQLKDLANGLCYLVSLARGTKIQWVYVDFYDERGQIVMRMHSSRITKPYCPLAGIDPSASGRRETRTFLEVGYKAYLVNRASYKLDGGTIDAYLDGKAENDYLELRGVKLAVSMEMLKAIFLERPNSTLKGNIVPEEEFDRFVEELAEKLKEVLRGKGINSPDDIQAICNRQKLKGLNRRSFRYFLEKLCAEVGLTVGKEEMDLFIKCRDSLVHTGRFYATQATAEERVRFPSLRSLQAEYYFLVNFLDRVFLKLLGYSGAYMDWRLPDGPVRRQNV